MPGTPREDTDAASHTDYHRQGAAFSSTHTQHSRNTQAQTAESPPALGLAQTAGHCCRHAHGPLGVYKHIHTRRPGPESPFRCPQIPRASACSSSPWASPPGLPRSSPSQEGARGTWAETQMSALEMRATGCDEYHEGNPHLDSVGIEMRALERARISTQTPLSKHRSSFCILKSMADEGTQAVWLGRAPVLFIFHAGVESGRASQPLRSELHCCCHHSKHLPLCGGTSIER